MPLLQPESRRKEDVCRVVKDKVEPQEEMKKGLSSDHEVLLPHFTQQIYQVPSDFDALQACLPT